MIGKHPGNGKNRRRCRQHTDLDRGNGIGRQRRAHLLRHALRRHGIGMLDPIMGLHGDGGDCHRGLDAEGGQRLDIAHDPCAAGGIGACNDKHVRHGGHRVLLIESAGYARSIPARGCPDRN